MSILRTIWAMASLNERVVETSFTAWRREVGWALQKAHRLGQPSLAEAAIKTFCARYQ